MGKWCCLSQPTNRKIRHLLFSKSSSKSTRVITSEYEVLHWSSSLLQFLRRRLQDALVKINIFVLAIRFQDVFKTFSGRLQDVFKTSCQDVFKTFSKRLAKTSSRHLQDVSKTFLQWWRLQDIFKTSCQDIFKTSSKRLQDVCKNVFKTFSRRLQDVFNTSSRRLQYIFTTSCKDAIKMFWIMFRIIRLNCLPSSRICLGHISEKFMVSAENLQMW